MDGEGRTFVNLMTDSGLKAVLADPDNKELLIELLNLLLPEYVTVKDITKYRDREKTPDFDGAKKTVLDLSCEGEDGSIFNVEVQQEVGDFFFERIVYYAAGDYHAQLLKGVDYKALRPVYEIVIMQGVLRNECDGESLGRPSGHAAAQAGLTGRAAQWRGNDLLPDRIVTRYMLKEEHSNMFAPSSIFCIFAQLGRFRKTLAECRTKEDYAFYWFLNGWREDRMPEMFAGIPFCEKIVRACEVAGFSEDKYKIYQADMKSERDIKYFAEAKYERGLEEGFEKGCSEGLERGREEGREDERVKIARNLKAAGFSVEQIARATELSEKDILAL